MAAFALRRLAALAATLGVASVVIFLVMEVVPGDPAAYMLGIGATIVAAVIGAAFFS